jgi:hypothetical protein
VYRVRFHATTAYTAQTVDWPRRTRELLDDANENLGASFRARLEVDTMAPWTGGENDKSLSASLAELQALDPGDDVDWVVGLVGGMSQLTTSFHELGMAPLLSKHLVIRATGKLDEHDGVDQAFNELNDEARTRLRRDRRRHRATAVFLHELGHTLGAMHEPNPHSLMFPQYRTDMEMFDEEAAHWIGTSLAHRTDRRVLDAPDAFAKEVLPSLRTASGWVPQERDEMVAHLEQWSQPKAEHPGTPAPAAAKEAPAASTPADVVALPADAATLPETDRMRLSETLAARSAGDGAKAWTTGLPLFRKYADVYSIQELHCQLASTVGLAWTSASR